MKLLLSVTLLAIFSISAEGLQCCTESTCSPATSVTCSTETMCVTASILETLRTGASTELSPVRGCASFSVCPSTGPKTSSVDLGHFSRYTSAECCNTDNCNSLPLPSLPTTPAAENGLICSFCYAGYCNVSVDCQGEEDMCFQGNDIWGNPLRGCASSSVCKPAQIDRQLPFFGDAGALTFGSTCCDTNDCNDGTTRGLQCLSCSDSTCSTVESVICSTDEICITASIRETRPFLTPQLSFYKGCASSSLCSSTGPNTFSVDLGHTARLISVDCCDTHNCNFQTLTTGPIASPSENNLRCFFCVGDQCGLIVDCLVEADTCIRGTDNDGNLFGGCASTSVCQAAQSDRRLPFFEGLGKLQAGTSCITCSTPPC